MLFLHWDSLGHLAELIEGTVDPAPRLLALPSIHLDSPSSPPPSGPLRDRHHDFQIAQQLGGRRHRRWRFDLPPRFQEQFWMLQNALLYHG
jgi:hypothetical protein